MGLDEYSAPTGAYYTAALAASFANEAAAEGAITALRAAGFGQRDINVARTDHGISVVVSEPTPGMIQQARGLLETNGALDIHPYGTGSDAVL